MRKSPAKDAMETLNCISKNLFSSTKKDSPKKYAKRQYRGSPTSVTAKEIIGDTKVLNFDTLAPESLFKLLKDLKWKSAASRTVQFQDETRRWVIKYDDKKRSNQMLWKRLPIHEACIRQPSTEIIAALLDSYSAGASAKDNKGRTPLHHAIIHGAHIDVIYLLLHAAYDVTQDQDFFNKIPRDYSYTTTFSHKAEVIAALSLKSKQDIASAAAGVRVLLRRSHPTHGAGLGNSNVSETSALEEQLAQAMTEVDAANTMREVATANEEVFRMEIRELKEIMIGMQTLIDEDSKCRERNENCIFLLEKKLQAVVPAIAGKDQDIKTLKNRLREERTQGKSESVMRRKLKDTVTSLTSKLNASSAETNHWKNEAEILAKLKNEAETKQRSLEDLMNVYKKRSDEFEEKFNEVKVHITTAENATFKSSAAATGMAEQIVSSRWQKEESADELLQANNSCTESSNKATILEQLLTTAEDEKIQIEQRCTELEEELVNSQEEVAAHKVIIQEYHEKVSNLKDSLYQMSGQLVDRSGELNAVKSTVRKLEKDIATIENERDDATKEKTYEKEINFRDDATGRIEELQSLILDYDDENQNLAEKCATYEKELDMLTDFTDDAESKIEDLEQLVRSCEKHNAELESKYKSCKAKLHTCKEGFEHRVASLEDLVKSTRVKAFESNSRLEKEKRQLRKELQVIKKVIKNEKGKRSPRDHIGSDRTWDNLTRDLSNDLTKDLSRSSVESAHSIYREGDHKEISAFRSDLSRSRYSASQYDDTDQMSVSTSISAAKSVNSTNSGSSLKSTSSWRSASSLTHRSLKYRIRRSQPKRPV